jgi:glutamate-1-semialdehyde 2,1-aminomutase
MESRTFTKSEALLDRALKVIPVGTQTFSKSVQQFPRGVSPLYMDRGQGSKVWDVDGNEYIDFGSALTPIILGYNFNSVNDAVRKQMEAGVIFGLPHELEVIVSEQICEMVPCAEMVRFGKNGSDATSAAVRLARAYTGRDHIIQWGYHGWQDWSNGISGRNKGVPGVVRQLTHTFRYNDLDSLRAVFEQWPNQVACVIMEPANSVLPNQGFLQGVKDMCHQNGALFVLDEVITGFRYARGGASEYFGVTPDLACFGKGIANGYPLSALAGRRDVMKVLEDVHFSTTYAGECLSLAAAHATLTFLQTFDVSECLASQGRSVIKAVEIAASVTGARVTISGHPSWTFLHFASPAQLTLWKQEIFQRGILSLGQHSMSWSHTLADVDQLSKVYTEVFQLLARYEGREQEILRCAVPKPLFQVR